jgi:hypothetical protein
MVFSQRGKKLGMSGTIFQERARQIATELGGKVVFKVSNSWLQNFKARYRVYYRAICHCKSYHKK